MSFSKILSYFEHEKEVQCLFLGISQVRLIKNGFQTYLSTITEACGIIGVCGKECW